MVHICPSRKPGAEPDSNGKERRRPGPPESSRRQLGAGLGDARLPASNAKHSLDDISSGAFAAHAAAKARIVQLAASKTADTAQYLVLALGEVPGKPLDEEVLYGIWETDDCVACEHGPGAGRGR